MKRRGFIKNCGLVGILASCKFPALGGVIPFGFMKWHLGSIPNCVQFYDATQVTSTLIAIDRSPRGANGGNSNVTVVGNITNGRPVFRFNGSNGKLVFTTIASGTNFSAFMFAKTTNSTTAAGVIGWINNAADQQIVTAATGPVISCYAGASNYPKSSTIDNYTAFSSFGVVCTAGTCVFYQNGASIGTGAQSMLTVSVLNFGGSSSFFGVLDMNKCVFITRAISASEIAAINSFMQDE